MSTETQVPVTDWLATVELVVVGSTNPVKIAAVAAVMARVAKRAAVVGCAVPSGVPDQPWGDEETIAGARARAAGALAQHPASQADGDPDLWPAVLAVGLEGGVVQGADGSLRTCAWAVVRSRDGREGVGGSLVMPLPERVAARLHAGEELGPAMDAQARTTGTKHGRGAVGILTAGLIDRQRAYEPLVTYALAPWLAPDYFASSDSSSVGR